MGIPHTHGIAIPEELLRELRRMVALGSAAESSAEGAETASVLRKAKAFEAYIKEGTTYG